MKFFLRFKKSKDKENKQSPIRETNEYVATSEDYVDAQFEKVSVQTIQQLYDYSNLLKKYINIIVNEVLRYPLIAVPKKEFKDNSQTKRRVDYINKLLVKANSVETFNEVRSKYIKDLYLYGIAGIEIEPTKTKEATALYAVPGYAIRLNVDNTGANFKSHDKAYVVLDPNDMSNPDKAVYFPVDSFIYFVLDNLSDRLYGSSYIASIYSELMTDIKSSKNLSSGMYNVKTGIICLPKVGRKIIKDVISRFGLLVKKNARTKLTAVNSDGKFIDLSNLTPKDAVELQKWLSKKANVFNIPPFKLGLSEGEGSLNAREQKDDFRALIEGIVKYEIEKLNSILVLSKLQYDDVEITCPNFATKVDYERARIAVRLVNGKIITPNEARHLYLGLPPLEDPEANKLQGADTKTSEKSSPQELNINVTSTPEKKSITDPADEALKVQQLELNKKKQELLDKLLQEE